MTNVFEFPKSKIVREVPLDIEEVEKAKEKGKQNYADGMTEEISTFILAELENFGIDAEAKEFTKDFIFLNDVVKCLIYRNMGLQHSLQNFIDEHVQIVELKDGNPIAEDETIG
jgi:hypothetical protein